MKYLFVIAFFLMGSFSNLLADDSEFDFQVDVDAGPVIWVGPGLYYGVWFDDEDDYDDWYHNHHHNPHGGHHGHHGDHHGGDHHGHHGGGGHHHK